MDRENCIVDLQSGTIITASYFEKPFKVVLSARDENVGRWERYTDGSMKNTGTGVGLFKAKTEEIGHICMCLNHGTEKISIENIYIMSDSRVVVKTGRECRNALMSRIEHNRATLQCALSNEKLNFLVEEGSGCKLIGLELHAESLAETGARLALKELSGTEARPYVHQGSVSCHNVAERK